MEINLKEFNVTKYGEPISSQDLPDLLVNYCKSLLMSYKSAREVCEDNWLEAWSLYTGTPEAVNHQRSRTLNTVGAVNNDWRHRINTGKSFESVETVHSYLMGALFPNEMWFDLKPKKPGYAEEARVIRKFLLNKFSEGGFGLQFEKYLRQLLVCGTSIMALPWRCETLPYKTNVTVDAQTSDYLIPNKKYQPIKTVETRVTRNFPEFECLNVFDCWLDPTSKDPNTANFIRRLYKTKADVVSGINSGMYSGIDEYDVMSFKIAPGTENYNNERLKNFQGINVERGYNMNDTVEVYEFWGDINLNGLFFKDVVATFIDSKLVAFSPNKFWSGKPFVVGSVTEIVETPYSIGILQPNLGLMHELNIITNQRLDCLEIHINKMFTLRQNSALTPEEVYCEPGKVFLVEEHGDLQPLNMGQGEYTITYQESSLLEQTIDKNIGSGNMISANSARTGERVTAAEIQATLDAGGNRLSNVHRHIQANSLMNILLKVYRNCQQFTKEAEIVRVSGVEPGTFDYHAVDVDSLNNEYSLKPIGVDYVTSDTKFVRSRMDFIAFASQVPQMAEMINYEAILQDVINHMGFDNPDSYIITKPPVQEVQQPQLNQSPDEANMSPEDLAYQLGGNSLKRVAQANMNADGGADYLARTTGVDINQPPTT